MPLLSIAIWLPIVAGVLLLAFGRDEPRRRGALGRADRRARELPRHDPARSPASTLGTAAMQFAEKLPWIERFNVCTTSASTASRSGSCC